MEKSEFALEGEYRYDRLGPVRWIASHALRYPLFPLLMILAAIGNNTAYSYVQIFIGQAFDLITRTVWTQRDLVLAALAVFGATISTALTGLVRNYAGEFLAQRIERDSRHELYVSLLGKSQTFHGRQRVGDIMARATNDVHTLNLMFSPGMVFITDMVMNVIIPVVLIGTINPRLLLLPLIFVALLVLTLADYNRRLRPVTVAMRDQFGVMNAGLTEAIAGVEVVKANVREHFEWDKFIQNARVFRNYYVRQGEIEATYFPMLAFSVCWAVGIFHALLVWRTGLITLGDVVSFVLLMGALRFPTSSSLFTFDLVQLGIASARRILEMINAKSDLDRNEQGHSAPMRGEVEFRDVSFRYNGQPVLQGVSFSARAGETMAIVGQTGSGKTTLTRLINRIFDASEGSVRVDGLDVREWNLESLRSQISTIEQDIFLFSRTIAENIAFGRMEATQEEIERAAREAQAHDFIMAFADGYQTVIGERGVTLSGGQRQRLAIARAFLTDPRILILDDSTSAIDSATEDLIQRAMRRISVQRTTFLITHRLSQIRWADRILVLRRGQLTDLGSHEELMARSADYRKIFLRYE